MNIDETIQKIKRVHHTAIEGYVTALLNAGYGPEQIELQEHRDHQSASKLLYTYTVRVKDQPRTETRP